MVTLLTRFTAAKEYIVIDNEQSPAHYAITYHSFTLPGKEYSGHTFQLYKQVADMTIIVYNKEYLIDCDYLLLGDFKIPLH
jgi:hypothetical protein